MAAGLPVIANPVGVHRELVRTGESGFLVESAADWIEAVRVLAADAQLRARFGRAGRELVEREYGASRGAVAWRTLLSSLAPARQAA